MATTATSNVPRRLESAGARSRVDRAIVSVGLAAVTLVAAVVFVVAVGLLPAAALISDEALRTLLLGFADADGATRALIASASAAIGIAGGVLFVGRLARGAVTGSYHVVTADEQGVLLVDRGGVARIAEGAALRAPGVIDAEARISGAHRGPVRVRLAVSVVGGGDLKAAGEQARIHARRAVQELAGVEVSDVVVAIDVAPAEYLERGLV